MARIDFRDVRGLLSDNSNPIENTLTELARLNAKIEEFASDPSFRGNTAQAMKMYLTDVHGGILDAFKSVLLYYRTVLEDFSNELSDVDPRDNTIIDMDYLREYVDGIQPLIGNYEETEEAVRTFLQRFDDFIVETGAGLVSDIRRLTDESYRTRQITDDQMRKMGELDYRYQNKLAEAKRLLDGIDNALGRQLFSVNGVHVLYNHLTFATRLRDGLTISEQAVENKMNRFFTYDEDGNRVVDLDALQVLFSRLMWGGSDFEYRVLLAIHQNGYFTCQNVLDLYSMLGVRYYDPLVLDNENVQRMLFLQQRIEADLFGRFMEEVEYFNRNYLHRSDDERRAFESRLAAQLLRTQLVAFVGGTPEYQWQLLWSADINIFRVASERNGFPPLIIFQGERFYGTTITGMWSNESAMFNWLLSYVSTDPALQIGDPDRVQHLISLALLIGGNIKYVGVSAGFRILKTLSDGHKVIYIINEETGHRERLTEAEYQLMQQMGALGIAALGGGVAAMRTPSGPRIIGYTTSTPDATIRLAGLANPPEGSSTPPISPESAMYLMSQTDSALASSGSGNAGSKMGTAVNDAIRGYRRIDVYNFLFQGDGNKDRRDFENALNRTLDTLHESGNSIVQGVDTDFTIHDLPLDILEQVIAYHVGR